MIPRPAACAGSSFAPTNPPYSVEPAELKEIVAAARHMGLRIHGHLSECAADVDHCLAAFGKRPVAWMADHDWLGPDVWFAHLVHVNDREIELLVETGTGIAHCPQSNCRLGSGIAPAEKMAARGGAVSLAVDGAASNEAADMVSEMHSAWHVHRAAKGAAAVSIEEVVRWASAGGARVLGFDDPACWRRASSPTSRSSISPIRATADCTIRCRDRSPPPAPRICDISWSEVASWSRTAASPGSISRRLRHDASRVVARLAALTRTQ